MAMQARHLVVVGRHHDPSDGWAREPHLASVVDIRPRPLRKDKNRTRRFAMHALMLVSGYVIGWWAWA